MGRESADFWHMMVEAKKLAFEDRARYYADPGVRAGAGGLAARPRTTRASARALDRPGARRATRSTPATRALARKATRPTCAWPTATAMMVSLIQSNYTGFGSGYVGARAGASASRTAARCSTSSPACPNSLAPGKRPFHTIIPAFVTKDGKPLDGLRPDGRRHAAAGPRAGDREPGRLRDEPAGGGRRDALLPHGLARADGHADDRRRRAAPRERRARRGARASSCAAATGSSRGGRPPTAATRRSRAIPATGVYAGATEKRKDGCAMGTDSNRSPRIVYLVSNRHRGGGRPAIACRSPARVRSSQTASSTR